MQHGIREFRPRQPLDRQLSSDTLNRILRELESLRITRVVNGTFKKLPGGTEIVVAPQSRGGTPAEPHPFQITSFVDPDSEPEAPNYFVTIRPGTLNNLLPTNTFDDGSLTNFALGADSIKYAVLTGQSDGKQFVSCSLSLESSPTEAQSPVVFGLPATAKFLLGIVYNASKHQIITDNINVAGRQQFTESKTDPLQPGELPYQIYYVWG